jgi:hypothetical protein
MWRVGAREVVVSVAAVVVVLVVAALVVAAWVVAALVVCVVTVWGCLKFLAQATISARLGHSVVPLHATHWLLDDFFWPTRQRLDPGMFL